MMKRAHVHLTVDVAMALAGLGVVCTGLLIWVVLPAHSRDATVWGWTRHDWGNLHSWLSLALITLLAAHLLLNWNWVCSVVGKLCGRGAKPAPGWRQLAGLAALLLVAALVGGFLLAAYASRQPASEPGPGRGWRDLPTAQEHPGE